MFKILHCQEENQSSKNTLAESRTCSGCYAQQHDRGGEEICHVIVDMHGTTWVVIEEVD